MEQEIHICKGEYNITIWPGESRGFFEWIGGDNLDDEISGGLWFEGKELVDADGTFFLPASVARALRDEGYTVDPIFTNEEQS